LYETDTAPAYARVVPAAVKADTSQIVPTLMDPRLDYGRVVIFDATQPVNPVPLTEMPAPSPSRATVTAWAPGRITVDISPAPPAPSYVLVAENWYKDWHARVDGDTATVLRGDEALITVPVPAGARRVELTFDPQDYRTGKRITQLSLLLLIGLAGTPIALRRRRRG
jgi:hypothetical protein